MVTRKKSLSERLRAEKAVVKEYVTFGRILPTKIRLLQQPTFPNPVSEDKLGTYRPPDAREAVTADMDIINECIRQALPVPSFLEAGPRAKLAYDPQRVRLAIVSAGGLAPGINCVIHSIVKRHWETYHINEAMGGRIFGIHESFIGLSNPQLRMQRLTPALTKEWLDRGGSMLGVRRSNDRSTEALVDAIVHNPALADINILYIIGGDGSLSVAHEIAKKAPQLTVVGIPKTMDNDVLWVWQSFGFNTAVEEAAKAVNVLHIEAVSTRRICIIELFGAESGFVAANASLASGHVDLVLIPEPFLELSSDQCEEALKGSLEHVAKKVRDIDRRPHALIVLAEGVAHLMEQKAVKLAGRPVRNDDFVDHLREYLKNTIDVRDGLGTSIDTFINQPRHHIRAVPPTQHDLIYCERLGYLAVDNALAGYTDFMISQWLTEYVLVPLELVALGQKSVPPAGIFWKQVVASTGQPFPFEHQKL